MATTSSAKPDHPPDFMEGATCLPASRYTNQAQFEQEIARSYFHFSEYTPHNYADLVSTHQSGATRPRADTGTTNRISGRRRHDVRFFGRVSCRLFRFA